MSCLKIEEIKTSVRQRVQIETEYGPATFVTFRHLDDSGEHVALIFEGTHSKVKRNPIVRVHSECLTGDVFGSARCDCGPQLKEAQAKMAIEGGILLYLRQEGRGIGLYNKLDAYSLQDEGFDTFEANRMLGLPEDARSYRVAAEMLTALGIGEIRLLTNNPDKAAQLRQEGIDVQTVVPTKVHLRDENKNYLAAKVVKCGHTIDLRLPLILPLEV